MILCLIGVFFFVSPLPVQADPARFGFPEVGNTVGVFAEQLPDHMTKEQIEFAATHYLGSHKLSLSTTRNLRKYNPAFIVLHYHLGIWQQQPAHRYITDGEHWGNDWQEVSQHEDWFWHNERGERVRSSDDGKYLMNIMNRRFQDYWKASILEQIQKGAYQGVFLDSSSVDLLQGEASKSDTRLARTSARDRAFIELGGLTWSRAYELFMKDLTSFFEAKGLAVIPNIDSRITVWDNTDYYTTASGAFMENAFMTRNMNDWRFAAGKILELTTLNKILIFLPYLKNDVDIERRLYFLTCYLLLKGEYSYITYFSNNHLSWYPEFNLRLGKPLQIATNLDELKADAGLYRRKFERGEVYVNPSGAQRAVTFKKPFWKAIPEGGGPVNEEGIELGRLRYEKISKIMLPPWSGAVLFYEHP